MIFKGQTTSVDKGKPTSNAMHSFVLKGGMAQSISRNVRTHAQEQQQPTESSRRPSSWFQAERAVTAATSVATAAGLVAAGSRLWGLPDRLDKVEKVGGWGGGDLSLYILNIHACSQVSQCKMPCAKLCTWQLWQKEGNQAQHRHALWGSDMHFGALSCVPPYHPCQRIPDSLCPHHIKLCTWQLCGGMDKHVPMSCT